MPGFLQKSKMSKHSDLISNSICNDSVPDHWKNSECEIQSETLPSVNNESPLKVLKNLLKARSVQDVLKIYNKEVKTRITHRFRSGSGSGEQIVQAKCSPAPSEWNYYINERAVPDFAACKEVIKIKIGDVVKNGFSRTLF